VTKRWRQVGSAVWRWGRRLVPVVLSVGLVTWMVWKVTPQKLGQAFATSAWPWLILATAVQVAVLFTWDTFSLWWLFTQPDRRLPFPKVLRARADATIWSAINLEIGQAVFAYNLAQALGSNILTSLGRCMALALCDLGTLQALGFIGSFVQPLPVLGWVRWVCAGIVGGILLLVLVVRWLPQPARRWLEARDWASWLKWWTWRHTVLLCAQRLVLFLLVLLYAAVGLAICRVAVNVRVVFGVVPFVLIAESLPCTGGLGERETALVYLLGNGADDGVLLSFGLIWSAGTILGRVLIGLVSAWLPRHEGPPREAPAKVATAQHAAS
jgi:hypothetical protein